MSNPFLSQFATELGQRYNVDRDDMSLGDWLCANTTLHRKPFSFARYPFQKAIADDMHDNMDVIKPSQIGLTEIQVRKALALCMRHDNLSIIFTLPNEDMFKRVSKARIKPILDNDRAFQDPSGQKSVQSMALMHIGTSYLYVTGAREADATSIPADIVFNDEIDLTDQEMLALFSSRLQNSDFRINQRFSTPTYEGFGVHRGYVSSDQREYALRCTACNHVQVPKFDRNSVVIPGLPEYIEDYINIEERLLDDGVIDLDTAHVVCEKCRKPLDLGDHANREWIATYPSRKHARGYQVRPFSTERRQPGHILKELFTYKRRDNLKGFCNTVLGETYRNENARLTDAVLDRRFMAMDPLPYQHGTPHWIGIDVGLTCHIVIARGRSLKDLEFVLFETCTHEELLGRVTGLVRDFKIRGGGIDRHPYTPTANAVRDATGQLVLPIEYRGTKEYMDVKDATGVITHGQVNRTMMLDYVANGLRNGYINLNGYGVQKQVIKTQLKDMVREEPAEGEAKWVKLNGNDHYFHAMAFLVSGMVRFGVDLVVGDYQNELAGFERAPSGVIDTRDLIGFSNGWEQRRSGVIVRRHSQY